MSSYMHRLRGVPRARRLLRRRALHYEPRTIERARVTQPKSPPTVEPPSGAPWDLPVALAPFAFVDLEMTGLEPEHDHVVEICIEVVKNGVREDGLATLVRPPARAGRNAQIHGLAEDSLEHAPAFAEVADRVLSLCDPSSVILVAHAAAWDVAFLEAELARCGKNARFPHFLDTLMLSRRAFALPSHSLEALARAFGVQQLAPHRASDDVRVLRRIFDRIVEVLAPTSPRDLWHVRIGERHARPEVVAACLRAAEDNVPVILSYRPARKAQRPMEAVITRVRTDLDPPRVLGYALPGRGRFDLRADRILAVTRARESEDP
jgi:DNA polymerase-3 subunit epsilon